MFVSFRNSLFFFVFMILVEYIATTCPIPPSGNRNCVLLRGTTHKAGSRNISVQATVCPPYILPNGTYVIKFSLTNPTGSEDFLPSLTMLIREMPKTFLGFENDTEDDISVTFFYHENTTEIDLVHCPVFLSVDKKWHIKLGLQVALQDFNLSSVELHYTDILTREFLSSCKERGLQYEASFVGLIYCSESYPNITLKVDNKILLSVFLNNNTFNIHGDLMVSQENSPKFTCMSTSVGLFQWNIPFHVLMTLSERNRYSMKLTLTSGPCMISEDTKIGSHQGICSLGSNVSQTDNTYGLCHEKCCEYKGCSHCQKDCQWGSIAAVIVVSAIIIIIILLLLLCFIGICSAICCKKKGRYDTNEVKDDSGK